jgi:hypothetical protein
MKNTQSKKWYLTQDGQDYRITLYYDKGGINYFTYKTDPRGYSLSVIPIEIDTSGGFRVEKHMMFAGYRDFLQPAERFSRKQFDLLFKDSDLDRKIQLLIRSCINKGWSDNHKPSFDVIHV